MVGRSGGGEIVKGLRKYNVIPLFLQVFEGGPTQEFFMLFCAVWSVFAQSHAEDLCCLDVNKNRGGKLYLNVKH